MPDLLRIEGLSAGYAGQPVVLERAKLGDLIVDSLLQQVADRLGVTISAADVTAELNAESDIYGGRRTLEMQASSSSRHQDSSATSRTGRPPIRPVVGLGTSAVLTCGFTTDRG